MIRSDAPSELSGQPIAPRLIRPQWRPSPMCRPQRRSRRKSVLVISDELVGCPRILHSQTRVPGRQPAQSCHDFGLLLVAQTPSLSRSAIVTASVSDSWAMAANSRASRSASGDFTFNATSTILQVCLPMWKRRCPSSRASRGLTSLRERPSGEVRPTKPARSAPTASWSAAGRLESRPRSHHNSRDRSSTAK